MSESNLLRFDHGTLLIEQPAEELLRLEDSRIKWDDRTKEWRTVACEYRPIVEKLTELALPFTDQARKYESCPWQFKQPITPRPHQAAALQGWLDSKYRGTVSIPTGGGKTILAVMAIAQVKRSTLVVVPTIELMHQWYEVLSKFLNARVGLLGGGYHEVTDLTVATYDSAHIHCERLGNRFGFLICDEAHHLPAPQYQKIALATIAPFRLGLSATVERADGKEEILYQLVGPLVYEGSIQAMVGQGLAPYEVITREIPMTDGERQEYERERKTYTNFLAAQRINLAKPTGWSEFIIACSRSMQGREAMKAYRRQKKLAQASTNKLEEVWQLIQQHAGARIIIFTDDNELAYRIGRIFFLPVLTHRTKVKERKKMLDQFKEGRVTVLVTSKVLNEGVDVPEARVGIIVSGSGAVREHVQRLGRILRDQQGKKALMYELVSKGTSEYHVNQRRREHHAYQGSASLSH